MLISQAIAQDVPPAPATETTAETAVPSGSAVAPDTTSILIQNIGMIVLLVLMFYFLLIRPQQRRFKEHKQMIDALKKGDRVVVGGGLVGIIDSLQGNDEVVVDLGGGMKVTALKAMVQVRNDAPAEQNKK